MQKMAFLPRTPTQEQALKDIIRLLKNPKVFMAEKRAVMKEQKDVAHQLEENPVLPPQMGADVLEFIGGPTSKPQLSLEQARTINKIKAAMSRSKVKALLAILKDLNTLELEDEDGNTPLLLALHYQSQSPYTPGQSSALNAVVASLIAADRAEGGKNRRLQKAFEHRNAKGLNAIELARALGLPNEVLDYLEKQTKGR